MVRKSVTLYLLTRPSAVGAVNVVESWKEHSFDFDFFLFFGYEKLANNDTENHFQ